MRFKILQIDAFTNRPFAGNPAAVCTVDDFPDDELMQHIASEMNLSETAFVVSTDPGRFDLRWFTPGGEVDLCGHATLASAHALFSTGVLSGDAEAVFDTKSGELRVRRIDADAYRMDFPSEPIDRSADMDLMREIVGSKIVFAGANRMDALVELPDADAVIDADPDLRLLEQQEDFRGLIITAAAGEDEAFEGEIDFVSRFFAPRFGVPEDPVTGSAHCGLAPYWAERIGRTRLRGYQASKRGGTLLLSLDGAPDDRVFVSGHAVSVLTGSIRLK